MVNVSLEKQQRIELLLQKINIEILSDNNDLSLIGGTAGKCLYHLLYAKRFNESNIDDKIACKIQQIVDEYIGLNSYTFSRGEAGINWFFNYLYNLGYIDLEDLNEFRSDHSILKSQALEMLSLGNYDFLHGALGIAYYLLQVQNDDVAFFKQIFQGLNALMPNEKDMLFHFDIMTYSIDKRKINMGFAHGISSVLKFCIQCCSLGVCYDDAKKMALKISEFLTTHINKNNEICYFSNWIYSNPDDQADEFSHLGWCYGDLSNAYVLHQAGKHFNNTEMLELSAKIFGLSFTRTKFKDTLVNDAALCHGSAGIAYVYYKMWTDTNDVKYKEACDYWIDQTISFSKFEDTISGYKKFLKIDKNYHEEFGLLEGSAGIGLVLLSYLTDDSSWDSCLMLDGLKWSH